MRCSPKRFQEPVTGLPLTEFNCGTLHEGPTISFKFCPYCGGTLKEEDKATEQAEEIYEIYPRKAGRPAALRAIKSAIKKVGFEELKMKVFLYHEAHKAAGTDLQYTPHPATWFNQERWNDELPKPDPRRTHVRIAELRSLIRRSRAFPGGPYFTTLATDKEKQEFAQYRRS